MNWMSPTTCSTWSSACPSSSGSAASLARNGQVFLADVFEDQSVATATNRLLVVGFYLLNIGFVLLYLRAATASRHRRA